MQCQGKEGRSLFRKALVLVVLTLGGLSVLLTVGRYINSNSIVHASDLGLTEADCRCCHNVGVPDRHHLLVETTNFDCLDCHEMFWDEPSTSWIPIVTRDCLVCHEGSLADRHHIVNNDCFACHEAQWDPVAQNYFITFANGCAPKATLENCSDGFDNNGNGQVDCNDAYCAGTLPCLPSTIEICDDVIDNNGNGLVDCDDEACTASPFCSPPQPEICDDSIDNDGNGLTDCADSACIADSACVDPPVEICNDTIDNDGDSWLDCDDPDCFGSTDCTVHETEDCIDGIDNDGDGLIDCADPDCSSDVTCEIPDPEPVNHYIKHQVTSNNCTACHLGNLHDEHKKNCNYCHQNPNPAIQQAVAAGSTDCVACHSATIHTMGCANCHKAPNNYQTDTVHRRHMARVACGVCHEVPETTNLEPTGQYCIICHDVARPYTSSEVPDLHRAHVVTRGNFPYSCNMCHGQNSPQIRPEQCSACHPDNRLYNPVDLPAIHTTHSRLFDCTNCHFDPRLFALDDQATSCLRCHEMRTYTSTYNLHLLHSGQSCWSCHTSNGVTARSGHSCASCHDGTTPTYKRLDTDVHERHTLTGAPCWTCHNQLVPVFPTLQMPTASPSGAITGKVTGSQGSNVDNATVVMNESGHSALSSVDGTYRLDFISPGNYTLIADKPGYQQVSQPATVSIGYTTTVDFTLTPLPNTGAVTGIILNDQGLPAVGATVNSTDMEYFATAGADGSYTLSPIVEGTYQLTAILYNHSNQSKTVTVSTGQSTPVNFTLAQLGSEDCFDGLDNDGDGLIDCDDNDCGPECNSLEEICGDGIDNDLDGQTDCFDQDCNPVCNSCTDNDNDGYYIDGGDCGAVDCNDSNPQVYPGVAETCDRIDNNCDGQTDEGVTSTYYRDNDADTYGDPANPTQACTQPAGYVTDSTDCNDAIASAYPGASEICDGIDNNCDGQTDEGYNVGMPCSSGVGICETAGSYVCSADNLGTECDAIPGTPGVEGPPGNPTCYDGLDNDCNGFVDNNDAASCTSDCMDNDGDGYGDFCQLGPDCDDTNAAIYPGASEICGNGIDENCDGQVDVGVTDIFYLDSDTDGFGNADNPIQTPCQPVDNVWHHDGDLYVADSTDCNDYVSAINPAATEILGDGLDNNCDGLTDCDDPAFVDDPACDSSQQEICDDGIDNDGDGNIDCADNQCQNEPVCDTSVNCRDIVNQMECESSGCSWNSKKDRCTP